MGETYMPHGFFHHVKIINITRGQKKEEISSLGWDSLALEVGGGGGGSFSKPFHEDGPG
jgi:hypothetical protein